MSMPHELTCLRPASGKPHPEHYVVHPELHEPEQVLAGDTRQPDRPVVGTPELLLRNAVVPASLLLFQEPDAVLRLPLPSPPMLSRRIRLSLQGVVAHVGEHYPCSPVAPAPRSRVTRHKGYPLRRFGGRQPLCG